MFKKFFLLFLFLLLFLSPLFAQDVQRAKAIDEAFKKLASQRERAIDEAMSNLSNKSRFFFTLRRQNEREIEKIQILQ